MVTKTIHLKPIHQDNHLLAQRLSPYTAILYINIHQDF